jgi:hypothetical protein
MPILLCPVCRQLDADYSAGEPPFIAIEQVSGHDQYRIGCLRCGDYVVDFFFLVLFRENGISEAQTAADLSTFLRLETDAMRGFRTVLTDRNFDALAARGRRPIDPNATIDILLERVATKTTALSAFCKPEARQTWIARLGLRGRRDLDHVLSLASDLIETMEAPTKPKEIGFRLTRDGWSRVHALQSPTSVGKLQDEAKHVSGPASLLPPLTVDTTAGSVVDSDAVLISYTHDTPEHKQRVGELAQKLRSEGVNIQIDQFVQNPQQGWPRWMSDQLRGARLVLCICTRTYRHRFEGREPGGSGSAWEGFAITQELYEAGGRNARFVPVFFEGATPHDIPLPLRGFTYYKLSDQYDDLYYFLTNQPAAVPVALGPKRNRVAPISQLSSRSVGSSTPAPELPEYLGSVNDRSPGAVARAAPIGDLLDRDFHPDIYALQIGETPGQPPHRAYAHFRVRIWAEALGHNPLEPDEEEAFRDQIRAEFLDDTGVVLEETKNAYVLVENRPAGLGFHRRWGWWVNDAAIGMASTLPDRGRPGLYSAADVVVDVTRLLAVTARLGIRGPARIRLEMGPTNLQVDWAPSDVRARERLGARLSGVREVRRPRIEEQQREIAAEVDVELQQLLAAPHIAAAKLLAFVLKDLHEARIDTSAFVQSVPALLDAVKQAHSL